MRFIQLLKAKFQVGKWDTTPLGSIHGWDIRTTMPCWMLLLTMECSSAWHHFFAVLWVDFYKWIMSLRTQEKESSVIKMQLPFLLMRPRGIYNCYSMMIITRIECLQRICKGKTPNVCEVLRYSRNIGLNI